MSAKLETAVCAPTASQLTVPRSDVMYVTPSYAFHHRRRLRRCHLVFHCVYKEERHLIASVPTLEAANPAIEKVTLAAPILIWANCIRKC